MKKQFLIGSIVLSLFALSTPGISLSAETKKVCVKEFDNKAKKEKEVCKTIKVHKKLEGTKIPEKK